MLVANERRDYMEEIDPVVYVVDDSEDNVTVYSWMLSTAWFETKTYLSGLDFLNETNLSPVGCILLDNQMPALSGLGVQRKLLDRGITLPVVFMSGASSYSDVVEATRKGAHGFLEKPFHKAELLQQVNAAIESSCNPDATSSAKSETNQLAQMLTKREYQVCKLIIAGNTNRSIADQLGISVSTVEFHRANLMDKLEVNSLAELVKLALKLDA